MKGLVFLIDDDAAVRRGVGALLQAAGYRTALFESADRFLAALPNANQSGAVILCDVCMPGMQGPELQQRLRDQAVGIPVVIMTAHGDVQLAVSAMRDGAIDFLEKPFTPDELTKALDRAFTPRVALHPLIDLPTVDIARRIASLTAREREVLREIVNGQSNKAIARDLDLSPRTIEVHRRNLVAKMQATSFAELVRMAIAAGFCD
ncbi:MAG: response regulator transcription factor [Parvularculaceae bacterium]